MSRSVSSVKNIVAGMGGQLFVYLLKFVTRTVFIHTLGKEYLGLQGLFSNILGLLNLAELGVALAVAYTLYKPLESKDENKIYAIMGFLKKAYFVIGLIILIVGSSLIPVLPFLMKGSTDLVNVNLIYILYLLEISASYLLFSYKRTILIADQKRYVVNIVSITTTIITTIAQFGILIVVYKLIGPSEAFICYLLASCIAQFFINFVISKKADKMYPYLKEKRDAKLSKPEKTELFKKIFGTSVYKINSTIVKSTDSILISSVLGLGTNGSYSNYYFITNNVFIFVRMMFSSVTASVGNLITKETTEKSEFIFRCLGQISYWIFGFFAVCMFVLIEPFVCLWAGDSYSLGQVASWIFALEFLMEGYQVVSLTYKDAGGLFWFGKYRPMVTAILNIIISLLLVHRLGVTGVILGTIISRFLTTWWFEPMLVYKKTFKMPVFGYFVKYIFAVMIVLISVVIVELLSGFYTGNAVVSFVIKMVLCIIVPNLLFFVAYFKTKEFTYIKQTVKNLLGGITGKLKRKKA